MKERTDDEETKKLQEKLKYDLNSLTTLEEDKGEIEPSDKEKVLEILLNTENINLKTELNDKEILELARLEIIGLRIHSVSLLSFLDKFKELRVSKDRQGRKEIIGAVQDEDVKKNGGFFDQFVSDLTGRNNGN